MADICFIIFALKLPHIPELPEKPPKGLYLHGRDTASGDIKPRASCKSTERSCCIDVTYATEFSSFFSALLSLADDTIFMADVIFCVDFTD
jgi:hypothetical protein